MPVTSLHFPVHLFTGSRLSLHQVEGVWQDGYDGFKIFKGSFRRAWESDDEGLVSDSSDGAREGGEGSGGKGGV